MDGRIFFVDGRQLSGLRTQDLPVLAKAICGFERGLVCVERCYKRQVGYVRLFAQGFEVYVQNNDWQNIVPYLFDGSLSPQVGAPEPVLNATACTGPFSWTGKDLWNLEVWDQKFYQKVYATLQLVFTQKYPTSKL